MLVDITTPLLKVCLWNDEIIVLITIYFFAKKYDAYNVGLQIKFDEKYMEIHGSENILEAFISEPYNKLQWGHFKKIAMWLTHSKSHLTQSIFSDFDKSFFIHNV